MEFIPPATGTYKSRLSTFPLTTDFLGGTYTFSINIDAQQVTVGVPVRGEIDQTDDQDMFQFTTEDDTNYVIEMKGVDSGDGTLPDPKLHSLWITRSGVPTLSPNSIDSDIGIPASRNAIYEHYVHSAVDKNPFYVLVESASGTGTYEFSITEEARVSVPLGGEVDASISFSSSRVSDSDAFEFEMVAGKHYQIEGKGAETGDGTLTRVEFATFRYPDGTAGFFYLPSVSEGRVFLTAQQTGTFRMYVGGAVSGETGTYKMAFKELTPDDYSADTGTSGRVWFSGGPPSGSASGEIGIVPSAIALNLNGGGTGKAETDWFRVTLAGDTTYGIVATGAAGDNSLSSPVINGVYDSSGNLIAGTAGRTRFTTNAAGGFYYIEIASRDDATTGAYDLTVTVLRNVSNPGLGAHETEVWSTTMRVQFVDGRYDYIGYHSDKGSIADATFTHSSTDYMVGSLLNTLDGANTENTLTLAVTPAITDTSDLALYLNDVKFTGFGDYGSNMNYTFTDFESDWADGQNVAISLRQVGALERTGSFISEAAGGSVEPMRMYYNSTRTARVGWSVPQSGRPDHYDVQKMISGTWTDLGTTPPLDPRNRGGYVTTRFEVERPPPCTGYHRYRVRAVWTNDNYGPWGTITGEDTYPTRRPGTVFYNTEGGNGVYPDSQQDIARVAVSFEAPGECITQYRVQYRTRTGETRDANGNYPSNLHLDGGTWTAWGNEVVDTPIADVGRYPSLEYARYPSFALAFSAFQMRAKARNAVGWSDIWYTLTWGRNWTESNIDRSKYNGHFFPINPSDIN